MDPSVILLIKDTNMRVVLQILEYVWSYVEIRAPNESDRPAGNCGSSPTARVRVGGSRGADPTRLDPQDPRMTREYIIIYILFIYLNKMDNYIIVLR